MRSRAAPMGSRGVALRAEAGCETPAGVSLAWGSKYV